MTTRAPNLDALPLHAALAFNRRPLLLERSALDAILAARPHLQLESDRQRRSQGYLVAEGVAVVPVFGTFMKRGTGVDWLDEWLGVISTEALADTFRRAMADPSAEAVLLHIDSPGGEARGVFDLADQIYAARGEKPIWAMADEWAYSAAYLVASAADRIVLPRTGGVGSIGVYTVRVDATKLDENLGIRWDIIEFGTRKADGHPHKAVSDPELADLQAYVDRLGELFVATVARNRGISAERVRETEARTINDPDEALRLKLADEVATFPDTLMELATAPRGGGLTKRRGSMAQETETTEKPDNVVSIADHREKVDQAKAAGHAEGSKDAVERVALFTDMCAAAGKIDLLAGFVADKDATMATVAKALAAAKVADSGEEITGQVLPGGTSPPSLTSAQIYERRKQAVLRAQGRVA